jgi:hypothetical protein
MSSKRFAAPVAYWVRNRTRDEVLRELGAIDEQLAEALAGRRFLPAAERVALEAERQALKKELAALDAKQFHDTDEEPAVTQQTAERPTQYSIPEARARWLARNKGKAPGAGNGGGDEEAQMRGQVEAMTARVERNGAVLTALKEKFRLLGFRFPTGPGRRLEFLDPAGNVLVFNASPGEGQFALPSAPGGLST